MRAVFRWLCLVMSFVVGLTESAKSFADEAKAPARKGKNVVYITWDGFRWQELFGGAQETLIAKDAGVADIEGVKARYWRESEAERREVLLPFVWKTIAKQGQSNKKFPNPHVNVLEFLNRRPGFEKRVAAIATWDVFPSILNQPRSGLYVHAGVGPIPGGSLTDREKLLNEMIADTVVLWPDNQIDVITMQVAREYLLKHKPRVLFIGLGETDEWGHGRRYDRYLHSANRADAFTAKLWELLQSLPDYKDQTSIVLSCDHGRGNSIRDWTDHGAKIEGAEFVWSAVLGPDTPALGVRSDVNGTLSQVAATLATLVGEDFRAASPKSAAPLPGIVREKAAQ
ncbi:MAG: hypothetical protein FD138_3982 [Planctomycetota bacterium]|nr:MAG: hypothetical protein FD138_3982 [Planctomycetota bacterium]